MSKYTPGPWQFGHFGTEAFWIGPDETVTNVALVPHDCAEARDESLENARLISASPDLLSELRGMVADVQITAACMLDSVETHGTHGGWLHEESTRLFSAIESARSAIAKATGEQS